MTSVWWWLGVDVAYQSYLNDFWAFDVVESSWTKSEIPIGADCARSHAALAAAHGAHDVLCIGGARYFEGVYFNEISLIANTKTCQEIYAGCRVVLSGLVNKKELNDSKGCATRFMHDCNRWSVRLDQVIGRVNNKVSIKDTHIMNIE